MTVLAIEFHKPRFPVINIVHRHVEGDRHSVCLADAWSLVAIGPEGQEDLVALIPMGHELDRNETLQAARDFFGLECTH